MHSDRDAEMQQVVGAPKKKKQKTKNDYVVSKVSKESPKAV